MARVQQQAWSMEVLPDEVLALVLTYLTPRDLLLCVERLNHRFRALLSDEVLWNFLVKSYDCKPLPLTSCHGSQHLKCWEDSLLAQFGWKTALKAQHLLAKNWKDGGFQGKASKDPQLTRSYCVLFDEERDVLFYGNTRGVVHEHRLSTNKPVRSWRAHPRGYLYSMAFVPDSSGCNNRLATGALDQMVRVWDLNTTRELCHLSGHTGSINALCVLPSSSSSNNSRLVSCSVDHTTRVWDLERKECVIVLDPGHQQDGSSRSVNCVMAWSPREVLTANNKGEIHAYDLAADTERGGLPVATFNTGLRTVLTFLQNPQRPHEIFVGGGPLRETDGGGHRGYPVLRYDLRVARGHELVLMHSYFGSSDWVETAALNGIGHLITGANDGTIAVFDVESGSCVSKTWDNGNNVFGRLERRVTCMQASPRRLVSGSMDGVIRHWDFTPL